MIRGAFMVILAGILWGASGTLQAFSPSGTSPLVLGEIRITLGGLFLVAFVLFREGPSAFGGKWPWSGVCMAAVGMACYQLCFFAAILRTGVAVGTMVAIGSSPVMGGLLARALLGEALTMRWVCATAVAVAGCSMLSLGGAVKMDWLGIALALGAGTSYGFLGLGMKKVQMTRSPLATIAFCMSAGALIASPLYLFAPVRWMIEPHGAAIALVLGFFSTAIPYGLYSSALAMIPVSTACTLTLAEPLTASVFGVFLLGETLAPVSMAGIALVLSGLVILSMPGGKKSPGTVG